MQNPGSHLVFYDGECGLCDQAVRFILKRDKRQIFLFASLYGKTAAEYLADLPSELKNSDSLILIENFKKWDRRVYIGSTAVFRICWLLGGGWSFIGLFFFLPAFLFNWAYRLVANNRHRFFDPQCVVIPPDQQKRFLP